MVVLTINNSVCHIIGLPEKEFGKLRRLLSYKEPNQAYSFYTRYLLSKRGDFPTGLLYLVRGFLNANKIKRQVIDKRIVPNARIGLFKGRYDHTPYPEQKMAARASQAQERGIVVMPTGVGKSMTAALMIEALQVPTLVVVPSLGIKKQMIASLSTIFGPKMVGPGRPIWVANVDSLDPREPAKGYDCVIIDEFHHSGANTYRDLNKTAWAGVYYKFGLTATPFRSQDHERLLLESVLSKVIYKLDYQSAVDKGYIVPMEAYYVEIPKQNTEQITWAGVYSELVVHNKVRNDLIEQLLTKLKLSNCSTLCLVKEINHGKKFDQFDFTHGTDEDSRDFITQFNKSEISVLIGTTGILGEGVDTKPAEYIIVAGLGKSKNSLMQQFGRGFRIYPGKTSCKVILFLDKSHKFTKAHFKAQCKLLKDEYGVIPVKIDLT